MNDAYEVPEDAGFFKRASLKFLDAIDLSSNLSRMKEYVDSVENGSISLIMAILSFGAFLVFATLAMIYDWQPTWAFSADIRANVREFLSGFAFSKDVAILVGIIPVLVSLLPTGFEMLGSRAARFGIVAIQWFVWLFVVLDLVTDTDHVNHELAKYWTVLVPGDPSFLQVLIDPRLLGAVITYYVLWVLMLAASSYFFELVAALMLWASGMFAWKSVGYWVLLFLAGREVQRRKQQYERESHQRGQRRREA